ILFVPFEHGEVDDPAEIETVLGDETELGPDFHSRRSREFHEVARSPGDEEHGVADLQAKLLPHRRGALRPTILRHWPGPAFLPLTPEDVRHSPLALGLRPIVHAIAERATAAPRRRNRPHFDLRIRGNHARKYLEARSAEMRRDILHLDRIAQVGLVSSVH